MPNESESEAEELGQGHFLSVGKSEGRNVNSWTDRPGWKGQQAAGRAFLRTAFSSGTAIPSAVSLLSQEEEFNSKPLSNLRKASIYFTAPCCKETSIKFTLLPSHKP